MFDHILRTKLHSPRIQAALVPRTRLVERLTLALDGRLTVISAPAGFGKTTLVGELIAAQRSRSTLGNPDPNGTVNELAFGWLSLDEADNDPARFLAYLVAALRTVDETLGEFVLSSFQSAQPLTPHMALGTLINELSELSRRVVLVLDDYHLIESVEVHDALTYLLNHQPAQLHLVLITRADPPLPLARLRASRQMVEIRGEDLRFTTDEAAAFLREAWGIDISPRQVAILEARTEGWIAGLQLAALSLERLRTPEKIEAFVTEFSGSHRFVLDYLADEVLEQQPAEIQDFLLRSAVLRQLSAALCNHVLEITTGQTILERLEAENLFLVPLDDRREWYRYHHLFFDLLLHRLQQAQPDVVVALHRRAAAWYATNAQIGEAIAHALHAGDVAEAAAMIQGARWQMHGRGELATLRRWLQMLPQTVVDSTGALAMLHAWLLLYAGKLQDAEAYLARVLPMLDASMHQATGGDQTWRGELAVLQAQIALNRGTGHLALRYCAQAEEQIPAEHLVLRSILASLEGKANQMAGNLEPAQQAFTRATKLGMESGNQIAALAGLCNRAALCELQGRLHESLALQQEALALAQDRNGRPIPLAGIPHVGLGKIYREWNQRELATQHLEEAIRLGRQAGIDGIIVDAVITLALHRMGDGVDTHSVLAEAEEIVRRWQEPLIELRLAAFSARLWLAKGTLEPALAWAAEFEATYDAAANAEIDRFEIEYGVLARIRLAQGEPDQALAVLNRMLPAAQGAGRTGKVIEILSLQALAFFAQGDHTHGPATLIRALTLARPEGFVRTFIDEGRPMGELLARVAWEESAVAEYAARLLASMPTPKRNLKVDTSPDVAGPGTATPPSPPNAEPAAMAYWLAESLSARELEVLHLVAQGHANREIAARLIISIATVKKHIENIHSKLYVNNRTQAVARARELGIL